MNFGTVFNTSYSETWTLSTKLDHDLITREYLLQLFLNLKPMLALWLCKTAEASTQRQHNPLLPFNLGSNEFKIHILRMPNMLIMLSDVIRPSPTGPVMKATTVSNVDRYFIPLIICLWHLNSSYYSQSLYFRSKINFHISFSIF